MLCKKVTILSQMVIYILQVNSYNTQATITKSPVTADLESHHDLLAALRPDVQISDHHVKVIYRDLSVCKKPDYLPAYKANCWAKCKDGKNCNKPATAQDIASERLVS